MRVSAQMPSQREWVLPQRHFRMPVKKVANAEQTEKERPRFVALSWEARLESLAALEARMITIPGTLALEHVGEP
jgi:hypothetical protein